MRGAPRANTCAILLLWIIPAHAGSTSAITCIRRHGGDHPRACGEHSATVFLISPCWGSSPRMRGALRGHGYGLARHGIIPAHAGSTERWVACHKARRDHPRACGEHILRRATATDGTGSSPRMRGARRRVVLDGRPKGIIPAHAGSTGPLTWEMYQPRDHPRACGEHCARLHDMLQAAGSSPRMRGAHHGL